MFHAGYICTAIAKTETKRLRLQKISKLIWNDDDTPRSEVVKRRARIRAIRNGKMAKPSANTSRIARIAPPWPKVKSVKTKTTFARAKPPSKVSSIRTNKGWLCPRRLDDFLRTFTVVQRTLPYNALRLSPWHFRPAKGNGRKSCFFRVPTFRLSSVRMAFAEAGSFDCKRIIGNV